MHRSTFLHTGKIENRDSASVPLVLGKSGTNKTLAPSAFRGTLAGSPGLGVLASPEALGKTTLRLTVPRMKGPDVREAQMKLVSTGFPLKQFGIDGVFGPETEFAVKQFQKKNGLKIDGIVGTETWRALFAVNGESLPSSSGSNTGFTTTTIDGGGASPGIPEKWIRWGLLGVGAIGMGIVIAKS